MPPLRSADILKQITASVERGFLGARSGTEEQRQQLESAIRQRLPKTVVVNGVVCDVAGARMTWSKDNTSLDIAYQVLPRDIKVWIDITGYVCGPDMPDGWWAQRWHGYADR